MKRTDDSLLWNQFCKLGEMIGDGLHHEPGGKWITEEYRRLMKILLPQTPEEKKLKRDSINTQMAELINKQRCKCGGELKQKRSGTKVAYCSECGSRYEARTKKKRS